MDFVRKNERIVVYVKATTAESGTRPRSKTTPVDKATSTSG